MTDLVTTVHEPIQKQAAVDKAQNEVNAINTNIDEITESLEEAERCREDTVCLWQTFYRMKNSHT